LKRSGQRRALLLVERQLSPKELHHHFVFPLRFLGAYHDIRPFSENISAFSRALHSPCPLIMDLPRHQWQRSIPQSQTILAPENEKSLEKVSLLLIGVRDSGSATDMSTDPYRAM
jgi:hypothetical protein